MFQVTDVRLDLLPSGSRGPGEKLLAFATVTLDDCLVVHGVKVIRGQKGVFLAFPTRRKEGHCPCCRQSIPVVSKFCFACGAAIDIMPPPPEKVFLDITHPLTMGCRKVFEKAVIEEFQRASAQQWEKEYESAQGD